VLVECHKWATVAALTLVVSSTAALRAAEITIAADTGDYEALTNGTTSNGVSGALRVGSRTLNTSATPTAATPLLPFALPAIPAGEEISTVTLSILTKNQTSNLPVANADLYGVGVDAGPTVDPLGSYYFAGADDSASGIVKLQDDFLVPADASAADTRHVSVDLSDYVKSLYAAGAAAGDFALLRLSYDQPVNLDAHNRYLVWSRQATSSSENPSDLWPLLVINTVAVPEPATSGVFATVGMLLLGRRRRRRDARF
jgi:hypothetical protein